MLYDKEKNEIVLTTPSNANLYAYTKYGNYYPFIGLFGNYSTYQPPHTNTIYVDKDGTKMKMNSINSLVCFGEVTLNNINVSIYYDYEKSVFKINKTTIGYSTNSKNKNTYNIGTATYMSYNNEPISVIDSCSVYVCEKLIEASKTRQDLKDFIDLVFDERIIYFGYNLRFVKKEKLVKFSLPYVENKRYIKSNIIYSTILIGALSLFLTKNVILILIATLMLVLIAPALLVTGFNKTKHIHFAYFIISLFRLGERVSIQGEKVILFYGKKYSYCFLVRGGKIKRYEIKTEQNRGKRTHIKLLYNVMLRDSITNNGLTPKTFSDDSKTYWF